MLSKASIGRFEIEKFDGKGNFGLWQRRVKDLLVQQGLHRTLTANAKKPEKMTDEDWEDMQLKAVSTIRLCLSDDVMYNIEEESDSKEVSVAKLWLKLESLYMTKSLTNKLLLQKELYSYHLKEGDSLMEHLNGYNKLCSQLQSVEVKIEDQQKAIVLLASLPPSYDHLVTTMIYGKETLDFEEVTGALISNDMRRKPQEKPQAEGLMVQGGNRGRKWKGTQRGGASRGRQNTHLSEVECYTCAKKGHYAWECPDKDKEAGAIASTVCEEVQEDGCVLSIIDEEKGAKQWMLDSACSQHMCPHRAWFTSYTPIEGKVFMADNTQCEVEGVGSVKLRTSNGFIRILTGVYHVPNLKRNVISLGALDEKDAHITLQVDS